MNDPIPWNFSGQSVLLTGGARGIGAAIVRRMTQCGAFVAFADTDEAGGLQLAEEVRSTGGRVQFLPVDAADERVWLDLANAAEAAGAKPSLVIPNAGIGIAGKIESLGLKDFETVTQVNLRSAWLAAQQTAKDLEASGNGSLILIGSVMASFGSEDYSLYTMTKAALEGLLHSLVVEFGPRNIRVNLIHPGFIQVDPPELYRSHLPRGLWREFHEEFGAALRLIPARFQPLRRCGVPDDIAEAVCFLHSASAPFISGASLRIDGGLLDQSPIRPGDGIPAFTWTQPMRNWLAAKGVPPP